MKKLYLVLFNIFPSTFLHLEITDMLNEVNYIQIYSSNLIQKFSFNHSKLKAPIEVVSKYHKYFSYAIIDTNFNLIIRTLNSEEHNVRDQEKKQLNYYLENIYFIFPPYQNNNTVRNIYYDRMYTNIDEKFSKINQIPIPNDEYLSIVCMGIDNLPMKDISLKFLSYETIHKRFENIGDRYSGIESILFQYE